MKAMVTGGAGFIGSTLVDRLLAEGWNVDAVDDLSTGSLANLANARSQADRRFSFHRIDVASPAVVELVAHRRPDVMFHLAAQADVRVSVARPVFDATVNILGTINMCEGALAAGTSAKCSSRLRAARSTAPPTRSRCVRASRRCPSRRTAWPRRRPATTSTTTARFAASSTPRSRSPTCTARARIRTAKPASSRSLPGKLLGHERPVIYGDGSQTRDFVYVDDVVDAFVRAVDKGGGLLMNIGTGVETSVQQLFDVMAKLTGFKQQARYDPPRPGEVQRSALDPSRAGVHLGWQPWTSVEEGVARTLEHFKGQIAGAR